MTAGAISLFRIVIYNEVCNPHVPAALSAQDFAKQHARGRAAAAAITFELGCAAGGTPSRSL
jgi:hypothetical protein